MVEQKGSGVGSVWNKGSWHWEERNYTEFAKQFLTKDWCTISLSAADAKIDVYEIKELKGSASVTIRKQKQIFMFEFEAEVYWRATCTKLGDEWKEQTCQGKCKIFEFNQEDDELSTDVTCEKPGPWVDGVKRAVRNQVTEQLLASTLRLVPAMKAKDIDDEKLARAKAEARAAEEGYKEAQEQTGELKQAIFDEQKKKEEEMKKQEAAKMVPQQIQVKQASVVQGTGSVWNTNSYHWEEKSVTKWADDTLKEVVSTFKTKIADAHIKITEVKEFKGESSVSIRKGKKIVQFDYNMKLCWEALLLDKDDVLTAKLTGIYELPEVSNDEEYDKWEVRTVYVEDKQNLRDMMNQSMRLLVPNELRKQINEKFVEELKKK